MLRRNPMEDKMMKIIHLLDDSLVNVRSSKISISQQMVQTKYYALFRLNDVSLSSSYRISVHEGFENMVASFTMIAFLFMSPKNKRVLKTTNLVLVFKGGLTFLS
jgi:hypothetical protein